MQNRLFPNSTTTAENANQKFFGWKNIGLLFGIYMFVIGFVYYGFNVIFPEMVINMKWSRGDASWAQTLYGLLYGGIFVPIAAIVTNKWGARVTIVTGIVVLITGCILLGTITTSITAWILIWGIVMSFGFALGGAFPIQTVVAHWFDHHRASAIGLVMSAGGVGGFIAQPLFTWIMQVFGGWQAGWLFASAFAAMALMLALVVVNKPADRGQSPDGSQQSEKSERAQRANKKIYKSEEIWSLRKALRTPTLWLLVVFSLSGVMPLYLLIVHGVLHLTDLQFEPLEAASMLSAMLAASACARFLIGWLGDRLEPRLIMAVLCISSVISLTIIWQAPGIGLLLLAGAIFGTANGGTLVMVPNMIANYFGAVSFTSINGFIFSAQVLISSLVPVSAGYLADLTGNYDLSFVGLISLSVFGMLCALVIRPPVQR